MKTSERLGDHERFKELAALAHSGALDQKERLELERHLLICSYCQEAYAGYALIANEGMDFLAAARGQSEEEFDWDDRSARDKLFTRIREAEAVSAAATNAGVGSPVGAFFLPTGISQWAAVAACLLVVVALGFYKLGSRTKASVGESTPVSTIQVQAAALDQRKTDDLIASQKVQLSGLQNQVTSEQQEVNRLRSALRASDARFASLSAASGERDKEYARLSEERDRLTSQLQEAERSYQAAQAELTSMRAERDRVLLRTTSLESKVEDLTAAARDQDRRLKDSEQYLASDRDIRELMGARKLYIADVFDVDSGSRTRKPFGRVFYTESKSLIFYAFDLDRQPGVQNASSFQVWGGKDGWSRENRATNLGILYMDSESNRRWVLRLQDPKQLAEIDAVFVTVEPHGGSQKPTGKPFLYALLRREANHP